MKTITIRGVTNKDLGLVVIDHEKPLLPPQNDTFRPVQGRDGQYLVSGDLGVVEYRVRFFRENQSVTDWRAARDEIVKWLRSRDSVNISTDDRPGFYYTGKVTAADVPERYKPDVSFWVTFTVQPFAFGTLRTTPLSGGTSTLNLGGNYETPYKLTIVPASTLSSLTVTVNGVELGYEGSIPAGATVTIDTDLLEVRVNGDLKVLEVDGYFEFLEAGSNTVTISAVGSHSIQYRERAL